MNASPYNRVKICLCQYKTDLTSVRFLLVCFYFCFYPWLYILNVKIFSIESDDVLSIAAHVFCNLFLKTKPFIWANFDHVCEVFQGLFFANPFIAKSCAGVEVEKKIRISPPRSFPYHYFLFYLNSKYFG